MLSASRLKKRGRIMKKRLSAFLSALASGMISGFAQSFTV
jgi:hypothetical protein